MIKWNKRSRAPKNASDALSCVSRLLCVKIAPVGAPKPLCMRFSAHGDWLSVRLNGEACRILQKSFLSPENLLAEIRELVTLIKVN